MDRCCDWHSRDCGEIGITEFDGSRCIGGRQSGGRVEQPPIGPRKSGMNAFKLGSFHALVILQCVRYSVKGGERLSRSAGGDDARAGTAAVADDAEQPWPRACDAGRAGVGDGAAGRGGCRLSGCAQGEDARAGAAAVGDDTGKSRDRSVRARSTRK